MRGTVGGFAFAGGVTATRVDEEWLSLAPSDSAFPAKDATEGGRDSIQRGKRSILVNILCTTIGEGWGGGLLLLCVAVRLDLCWISEFKTIIVRYQYGLFRRRCRVFSLPVQYC